MVKYLEIIEKEYLLQNPNEEDSMKIQDYWKVCLAQDKIGMEKFFHPDAYVNWYDTNERFTVTEFIQANCEYPGEWEGDIEKLIEFEDTIITVVRVFSKNKEFSLHVTSFFKLDGDKIMELDEYWGNDGEVPQWRKDMNIGQNIV